MKYISEAMYIHLGRKEVIGQSVQRHPTPPPKKKNRSMLIVIKEYHGIWLGLRNGKKSRKEEREGMGD